MDSVTQFALGASIGEAVLGRRVGNRAPLIGGMVATLPDLDSFIPWQDAVASFTYHRSATHSLLVLTAVSPVLTWLLLKLQPRLQALKRESFLLVFLALITHPLLDAFTVYGTQLLWPLTDYPFSGSTIFIVDPAYTLWLLIGFIAAMVMNRQQQLGHRLNLAGLVMSSVYLAWTVAAKVMIDEKAATLLTERGTRYERLLSTPAPFNTLQWRLIGRVDNGYFDFFLPVFGTGDSVSINHFSSEDGLLDDLDSHWPVMRLMEFTHGFYKVSLLNNAVLVTDLRMGLEGSYVFNFKVAEKQNNGTLPVTSVLMP